MSLGKFLPVYTVDDEGRNITDLAYLYCEAIVKYAVYPDKSINFRSRNTQCVFHRAILLKHIVKILISSEICSVHPNEADTYPDKSFLYYYYDLDMQCIYFMVKVDEKYIWVEFHGSAFTWIKIGHNNNYSLEQASKYIVSAFIANVPAELSTYLVSFLDIEF